MIVLMLALCLASAVLGRLMLTRDQALRTVTVRLPALGMLIAVMIVFPLFSLVFAATCFIGGSFYGLGQWWLPTLNPLIEEIQFPVNVIVSGRWE